MPSAITAPIEDGSDTSWRSMVLRTLPQFYYHGEVPENEEALEKISSLTHIKERLAELKQELLELDRKTDRQLLVEQYKLRRERLVELEEVKKSKGQVLDRYNKVKGEIEAWDAGELEFVKKHAIQLLNESIEHDCTVREEWYIYCQRKQQ